MSADISEVLAYAHQVERAVADAEPELEKIVEQSATNVQRGAKRRLRSWSRGRYLKHYPRSITHEMVDELEAEVGPDASMKQGGMGRGVEFGSVHTPPAPHLLPAADEEEPKFGKRAADVLWKQLK